jgi:exodeoxyribonuclease VII large subunit
MTSNQTENRPQRDIYSVSRLSSEVRAVLEGSFPLLWVEGEISNLARPASGHIYFSLKDPHSQVRCAMFRMKRQRLRFQPENGMQVLVRARISLYEARGEFQLIVEHMEPAGEGALRQAFEELKQRLDREGLFDTRHKQELPAIPRRIGIITSPSGAALRDVLTVLKRRLPSVPVVLYPTQVQGEGAAAEIIEMLQLADGRKECDLLILTRGGGSLEDLMAFNDEGVARAVHGTNIPVISAVGHEIDFTISDFVADRRAPTPSAAAELATPDRDDLINHLRGLQRRMQGIARQRQQLLSTRLTAVRQRHARLHPGLQLGQKQQRLDELEQRLRNSSRNLLRIRRGTLETLQSRLESFTPSRQLQLLSSRTGELSRRLLRATNRHLEQQRFRVISSARSLHTLSPLATLDRGYSITSRLPEGALLTDVAQLKSGDRLETRLARGRILSSVEEIQEEK